MRIRIIARDANGDRRADADYEFHKDFEEARSLQYVLDNLGNISKDMLTSSERYDYMFTEKMVDLNQHYLLDYPHYDFNIYWSGKLPYCFKDGKILWNTTCNEITISDFLTFFPSQDTNALHIRYLIRIDGAGGGGGGVLFDPLTIWKQVYDILDYIDPVLGVLGLPTLLGIGSKIIDRVANSRQSKQQKSLIEKSLGHSPEMYPNTIFSVF